MRFMECEFLKPCDECQEDFDVREGHLIIIKGKIERVCPDCLADIEYAEKAEQDKLREWEQSRGVEIK